MPERGEAERLEQRMVARALTQKLTQRRAGVHGLLEVAVVLGQLALVERLLGL